MTSMTRDEIISTLTTKLGLAPGGPGEPDLIGPGYALVVVTEPEEMTAEVIARLQAFKGSKKVRRMVAIPPKATVMKEARQQLKGSGIGVIDGRGFIIKPFSSTHYRSISLGTGKS